MNEIAVTLSEHEWDTVVIYLRNTLEEQTESGSLNDLDPILLSAYQRIETTVDCE